MVKKLTSIKFDEPLLRALDDYARLKGMTRTAIVEAMAVALLEGRLAILPRTVDEVPLLPTQPMAGCSPFYPAQRYNPEVDDD